MSCTIRRLHRTLLACAIARCSAWNRQCLPLLTIVLPARRARGFSACHVGAAWPQLTLGKPFQAIWLDDGDSGKDMCAYRGAPTGGGGRATVVTRI
jgi:hypothetical protein